MTGVDSTASGKAIGHTLHLSAGKRILVSQKMDMSGDNQSENVNDRR